jgi:hypothetical protein
MSGTGVDYTIACLKQILYKIVELNKTYEK